MRLAILLLILAGTALAAPPNCKTTVQNGLRFEICSRMDASCLPTVSKFQGDDWKTNWNGCMWDATFYKNVLDVPKVGPLGYQVMLRLVASYRDSERMDVTILLEWKDGTTHKIERKNVPIIMTEISDGKSLPTVDIEFGLPIPDPSIGVPTVEATERGGARSFSHSYK
jgi:hypothetical protein